jgi:ribosomal protein S18 acetylase RimI-like enzyme
MAKRLVPGRTIGKFSLGGESFVLRHAKASDAERLMEYVNSFVAEKAFLSIQEKVSLKQEKAFLSKTIRGMKQGRCAYILAEARGGGIAASASVNREEGDACRHVGVFGIAVVKKYRGMGLGKIISETVLYEAKNRMGIEIAKMPVVSENARAIKLYRKLGFRNMGVLPKGCIHFGRRVNLLYMYKKL